MANRPTWLSADPADDAQTGAWGERQTAGEPHFESEGDRGGHRGVLIGVNSCAETEDAGSVKTFATVVERDVATGFFVGYVPGLPGAHSQGASLDELAENMRAVLAMLLEDGLPDPEAEFEGIQTVTS